MEGLGQFQAISAMKAASISFVIRKKVDNYQLAGPCNVHNIMDGEPPAGCYEPLRWEQIQGGLGLNGG